MSRGLALVTGASRGIGKATALALAAAGFELVVTARTLERGHGIDDSDAGAGAFIEGSLAETVELIEEAGGTAHAVACDLLDPEGPASAVAAALEIGGPIELLVNNAITTGPGGMLPLLELTTEQLRTRLEGNVVAQLATTQAVLPGMLEQGRGRIINVTSHVAVGDPPAPTGQGGWGYSYAASKAAFHKMAPILAVELGPRGIVAFNVDPGFVHTEKQLRNAERNGLQGAYPGAPTSVPAAVIAWLATDPEVVAQNGAFFEAQRTALRLGLHADWRGATA